MSGRGIRKMNLRSKSEKAGLIFPVSRFHRYLKKQFSSTSQFKISIGAAVYAASVLEYLVAEIAEQAGNAAKVMKFKRINPRHIMLAVHQDMEMNEALKHVILPSVGRPLQFPAKSNKTNTNDNTKRVSTTRGSRKAASVAKSKIDKAGPSKAAVKFQKAIKNEKRSRQRVQHDKVNTDNPHVLNERVLFLGQKLTVLQGDIVTVSADAVVNPTNSGYGFSGEVGHALLRKGGNALEAEVNKIRPSTPSIKTCEAVLSGASNIPYKHVIHVNSPSWSSNTNLAIANLEKTITNILDLADQHDIKSIAMPSISSGGGGYPKQIAAETILRTINSYFAGVAKSDIKQIFFVIYDKETLDVYKAELTRLA